MSSDDLKDSDITPWSVYLNRRDLLKAAGIGLTSLAIGGGLSQFRAKDLQGPEPRGTDELGSPINPMAHATGFTNYYDVSLEKSRVKDLAQRIETRPWTLEVGGFVNKPQTFDIDSLMTRFIPQQKVRRMRCVEAWSLVIPWDGFPLKDLLDYVEPTSSARFVRFESKYDPSQFLGQQNQAYPWPYVEALRLDEAMNSLTMMAVGMYGQPMPKENGAPLRLVVPWKYGFKSAKAVVKIELTETPPVTFWNLKDPASYGFYANVNPEVHHPRWSQATEHRLGYSLEKIPTLKYNGYGAEVAHMYEDLDQVKNY